MRPRLRLFSASLLAAGMLLAASAAHGQREASWAGSFQASRTMATLTPAGGTGSGTIVWRCYGDTLAPSVNLRIGGQDSTAMVTYVVWRFDREKADTVFLWRIGRGSEWSLRDASAAFTRRARTAARLVVRVLGNPPSASGVEHVYDLDGGGEALGRLSCVRNPSSRPRVVGWPPPEGLVTTPDPGGRTYEAAEVDRPPEAVNMDELLRLLLRDYPPLLRDAGTGGTVVLRFRVLEDGRMDAGSATVLRSTHEAFARAVRWIPVLHFRPARVRGRPVRAWVELPITYEMRGSPPTRAIVRPGL